MSRRPVRQLLRDMLERLERIEEFVTGLDRDAFLADVKTADAVVILQQVNDPLSPQREREVRKTLRQTEEEAK